MKGFNWYKHAGLFAAILLLTSFQPASAAKNSSEEKPQMGEESELILQKRTVDPIKAGKRAIRVLVNYNATNYFLVEGKQAGLEYEMMRSFETYLNKGLKAEKKYHLFFIALPFDQLIPALLSGKGDIIAAGMTITAERSKKVEFTTPYRTNISEMLVRH
ncbi:MAG: transporter substrate-binding domain-containing protein, partial [Arenicellales bacterium]